MLLTEATEKQLQDELARRLADKEKARRERMKKNAERIEQFLTPDLVDLLVPTHDRTSCHDGARTNGVRISYQNIRCRRCALLDILGEKKWPEVLNLTVRIENFEE